MLTNLQPPYRYLDKGFDVEDGDIVVDAGVAEGNFALDAVGRNQKVYLVDGELCHGIVRAVKYGHAK